MPETTQPTPKPTSVSAYLLFLILLLVGFVMAGEWLLPDTDGPSRQRAPLLGNLKRVPAPYIMFRHKPNMDLRRDGCKENHRRGECVLKTNSMGFRGEEIPPKGEVEYRVLVLGGSLVFNGSTESNTIPGYLRDALPDELKPKVRVYNTALVGGISAQELALYVHELWDLEPDLLVVLDGFNDVYHPLRSEPRPNHPMNFFALEQAIALATRRDEQTKRGPFRAFVEHAKLLRALTGARPTPAFRWPEPFGGRTHPEELARWREQIVGYYLSNVEKLARIAASQGVDVLVALQPCREEAIARKLLADECGDTPDDPDCRRNVLAKAAPPSRGRGLADSFAPEAIDHFLICYQAIREGLARLDQQPSSAQPSAGKMRFVDLSTVFDGQDDIPTWYWDAVHPFDEGNGMIGRQLAELLVENGLAPSP